VDLYDGGDILVGEDLEGGQVLLGERVAAVLRAGALPVVLGGGHEVAFGSYLGWSAALGRAPAGERWGILNVDAHFDLREAPVPTSGTPFLQAARSEEAAGREFRYAVVGISRANNTRALLDTAAALGVPFLDDDAASRPSAVTDFVGEWLQGVDRVHLTLDLDALPAAVAPGVSAPAGFGIPVDAVRAAVRAVAASGKLGLLEVAELNPRFDVDGRTARTAARLVDEALRSFTN
jgi:formiminoglutamase